MFEAFLAKIGTVVLKTAVSKVAFSALKSFFRMECGFRTCGRGELTAVNDVPELGLFGLEVASGILSDSVVDKAVAMSSGRFDIEKRDNGLLIARNRLISAPVSLVVPSEVITAGRPILHDFTVIYNASYQSKYQSQYASNYRSRANR